MKTQIYLSTGEKIVTETSFEDVRLEASTMKFVNVEVKELRGTGSTNVRISINVNHIVKITE